MSLIDRTILEWAWMSEKGYPDINNENDLRVFESMFGFNLKETPLTPKELGKQNSKSKIERIDITLCVIFKIIDFIVLNTVNCQIEPS